MSRGFEKVFGKTDRCQIFLMDKARSFPYDEGRKDGMPMEIGAKLRQARIAAGLTQEQTAEALGVSRQSISNWENEKNYPDIVSVVRLSDLYAVSLDALLKEEAPMSDYLDYLEKLAAAAGMTEINSFASLKEALKNRMAFFASMGCNVSDHALEYVMYYPASDDELEEIFLKRLNKMVLTKEEELKFKTAFMLFVGKEYHKLDWAMQLHYGCKRDNNTLMFEKLGPDTGYDCINNYAPSAQMADFLNALIVTAELPRTVIYSLNPNDNQAIGTILGCFQDSTAVAKIQQGSAWWFNDHKTGMIAQMTSLANLGLLANFVGMLTDSRSFLSYTRHEYFRRILCELIGGWVENGEYPADYKTLKEIVCGISYNNAVDYFGFDL